MPICYEFPRLYFVYIFIKEIITKRKILGKINIVLINSKYHIINGFLVIELKLSDQCYDQLYAQSRFKFYLIILRIAVKNIVNNFLENFLQFKPWNTNKRKKKIIYLV